MVKITKNTRIKKDDKIKINRSMDIQTKTGNILIAYNDGAFGSVIWKRSGIRHSGLFLLPRDIVKTYGIVRNGKKL